MRYSTSFETRTYELDRHNMLKPTSLVQYMQETAERQIRDQDRDYDELYTICRKAYIVSRMNIEIFGSIRKYSVLEGETWTSDAKAANYPRSYEMKSEGKLIARGFSNWALVDVDSRKLVRQGEYDISAYAHDEPMKVEIPLKFRIPKELELQEVQRFRVERTMTDINGHMNNAMYFNPMYDMIPGAENMQLTSINIRFVHEAPLGSELRIYRSNFIEPGNIDPRAERIVYFTTEADGVSNVHAVFGLKDWKE